MDFRKILRALDDAAQPKSQQLTESTVNERSPLGDFTAWAGSKVNAKTYHEALSTLKDVLERKGGTVKHDVAYYAEHVARSFKGVDGKQLAKLYQRSLTEGYRIMPSIDRERYTEIPGLEGPFAYENGRVLYYDPKEGKYYDRDQDMYLDHDEALAIHNNRADLMHTESHDFDFVSQEAQELAAIAADKMAQVFKQALGVTVSVKKSAGSTSSGVKPVPRGWLAKLSNALSKMPEWEINSVDTRHKQLSVYYVGPEAQANKTASTEVFIKVYPYGLGFSSFTMTDAEPDLTEDVPALSTAAQEIFAALTHGVLSNSSAVSADNFIKSVVQDHGLSDADLPGVIAQVKELGYTGPLLDSLAETKVPSNYAAMMQKKKRKEQAAKNNPVKESPLDWGSMSKSEFKRREMEHELGDEDNEVAHKPGLKPGQFNRVSDKPSSDYKPKLIGIYYFDNSKIQTVGEINKARQIGMKQDKKGNWTFPFFDTSNQQASAKIRKAEEWFGKSKYWQLNKSKAKTESRVTFSIAEGQRHERFDNTAVYFNNEKVGLVGRVNETSNTYAFVTTRKEFAKLEKARFESKFDAQQYVEKMLEAYANSPDPVYGDVEDMTQTLAGGINKPKSKHFKHRRGDNALAADDCGCDLKESSVAAREKDIDGKTVIVTGVQGVSSKQFRKKFKTQSAAERWIEKNEDNIDNVHIFAESRVNESAAGMSEREAKQIVKLMKAMERPASPAMAMSMKKDLDTLKRKYNMNVSELLKLAKQKSVTEQTVAENERYYEGDQVVLRPEYAEPDDPDAVYTLKNWDGKRGWVVDEDGRGWSVTADQIAYPEEDLDEAAASTRYAIKHKVTKKTLQTLDSKEDADDTLLGLGPDSKDYVIVPTNNKAKDWSMKEGNTEEQLDELSPDTLRSYAKKAQADNLARQKNAAAKGEKMWSDNPNNTAELSPTNKKFNKRNKAVSKAFNKAAAKDPVKRAPAKGTFGDTRGYGQGRYMGDSAGFNEMANANVRFRSIEEFNDNNIPMTSMTLAQMQEMHAAMNYQGFISDASNSEIATFHQELAALVIKLMQGRHMGD